MSNKTNIAKFVRLFQLVLLFIALWLFFWEHIYDMIFFNKAFFETIHLVSLNMAVYSISIIAILLSELYLRRISQISNVPKSSKPLERLYNKNELINKEPVKSTKLLANKVGMAFLVIGLFLFVFSIIGSITVVALIGLGLTFWGTLFLFARPTKFVRSTLLGATALSFYTTLDRMIDDLNYKGTPLCIPPFPKDAYLPKHLVGMKDTVVFISAKESTVMPAIEELAKKQFMVKNPKGICVIPPGSGLLELLEKELKSDFSKIDQESVYDGLPVVVVNNLELASNFEIEAKNELFHVTITNSVYSDLYSKKQEIKSILSIGCPLISAVACALAKNTGKVVTITRTDFSPDLKRIEVWYQIVEG